MPFYDNPGQVNDEAINIVDGKTFYVVQIANPDGEIVDPTGTGSGEGGPSQVEVSNSSENPIPTSVPSRIPTTISVPSSVVSTPILSSNANRRGFSVANDSTATLRLSFSATATAANAFVVLSPGSFIQFDQQLIVPNAISGIWSAANGTAQVTEYI